VSVVHLGRTVRAAAAFSSVLFVLPLLLFSSGVELLVRLSEGTRLWGFQATPVARPFLDGVLRPRHNDARQRRWMEVGAAGIEPATHG